jgi:hypothetical protein
MEYMTAATAQGTVLSKLVLFMVCLSIAGTVVAGAHWFAIDRPQQDALGNKAPANSGFLDCPTCIATCPPGMAYNDCLAYCEQIGSCGYFIE